MTGFAELATATHFSFLRGASSPGDMVRRAVALGHHGIGIADRNTVAGVVQAHVAVRDLHEQSPGSGFKLAVGARLVFADGTPAEHRHRRSTPLPMGAIYPLPN